MRWPRINRGPGHPLSKCLLLFGSLLSPHCLNRWLAFARAPYNCLGCAVSPDFVLALPKNSGFYGDDESGILNLSRHSERLGRHVEHESERLSIMSGFIVQCIEMYSYIVLASVLVSWVQLPPDNPIVQILDTFTEPLLGPIRKVMPDMGGLDFSPIVLFFLLNMLSSAV